MSDKAKEELLSSLNITEEALLYCKFAGSCYLAASICGLLNIAVLYFHSKRAKSFETAMFILISFSNLTTNVLGIVEAGALLELYHAEPNKYNRKFFYGHNKFFVTTVLLSLSGTLGLVLSTSLAIRRAIKIIEPFYHDCKIKYVVTIGLLSVFYSISFSVIIYYGFNFIRKPHLVEFSGHVHIIIKLVSSISSLLAISGNAFCFITLARLHYDGLKNQGENGLKMGSRKQRAVVTLLLMNIPFLIQTVISALYIRQMVMDKYFIPKFILIRELFFVTTFIFTSCFNPFVLLCRTSEYRRRIVDSSRTS